MLRISALKAARPGSAPPCELRRLDKLDAAGVSRERGLQEMGLRAVRGGGDGFGFFDRIIAAFLACVIRGNDDGIADDGAGENDKEIMWATEDPDELDELGASLQVRCTSTS